MTFYLGFTLGVTPNCHNLTGFQYDWTPAAAAAAIETHRKPQPGPLIG